MWRSPARPGPQQPGGQHTVEVINHTQPAVYAHVGRATLRPRLTEALPHFLDRLALSVSDQLGCNYESTDEPSGPHNS